MTALPPEQSVRQAIKHLSHGTWKESVRGSSGTSAIMWESSTGAIQMYLPNESSSDYRFLMTRDMDLGWTPASLADVLKFVDEVGNEPRHDPEDTDDVKIGRALRLLRVRRGLTVRDVAASCGFTPTRVGEIERGRTLDGRPTDPTMDEHTMIMRTLVALAPGRS